MSMAARPGLSDFGLPSNPMPRTMLRPDDTTRVPRPFRLEDHDRPRSSSEDARTADEIVLAKRAVQPGVDSPMLEEGTGVPQQNKADVTLLSIDQTTDLFRKMLEVARIENEHALAGNEDVSAAMRPKLTLDLGHSKITRLPESVVDLIKADVERMSLSHNQIWHIPLRFAECSHLRYLNVRSNVFREIPRGVYKLPLLEILDISRNKIRKISKEIRNLTCLRVFSIQHNRVDDLPPELCEMTKLQILKVTENPLRFKLKKAIEAKEAEVAMLETTDQEKEIALTAEIKRHLRDIQPTSAPVDVESGGETSEGTLDTPKPLKRALSSRFPVIPSTSSSDSVSDLIMKSPSQIRPPPIPTRSHYRIASGQNASLLRRPGVAPLVNGNERNRSNSESVLQASVAARAKRMGMLRKEKTDLDPVDESRNNRHSHMRGFSHGSVLRSKSSNNLPPAESGSSSGPTSPREARKQRLAFVRRLSSLPEHKQHAEWRSPIFEGSKGVLYALYQIHPQISGLINVIKGNDSKRSSLELTFYNASSHVDKLNQTLEQADSVDEEDEEAVKRAEDNVQRDCATCIMAYTHVTIQLQDNIRRIVAGADARYVRTLMLLLYGSMIEMKNAIISFDVEVQTSKSQYVVNGRKEFQPIQEEISSPPRSVKSATPTRDRPMTQARPGARFRSETAVYQPAGKPVADYPANVHMAHQQTTSQYTGPLNLTGSTLNFSSYNSSVSSFTAGNTLNSSMGFRSRSNSRVTNPIGLTNSSIASFITNTPRSGESFAVPHPTSFGVRVNPATGLTESQEDTIFETIFLALTRAYDCALQAVPIVRRQFARCLEAAEENRAPKEVQDMWKNLVWRCKACLEISEALQVRLVNMRLNPVASTSGGGGGERNDRSFWQLCKSFMQSFVDLVTEMKDAKTLQMLTQDVVVVLRPLQKASREAGRLIDSSPWGYLTDAGAPGPINMPVYAHGPGAYTNGINGAGYYHPGMQQQIHYSTPSTFGASVGSAMTGVSPVSIPLPATPLSAALGPAAQATVPSTPANAYGDQFFSGNVFQRADSLLNMPQASAMNFVNRR